MTYGYGEEMPPRRRGPYRDEPEERTDGRRSETGNAQQRGHDPRAQMPQYGDPRSSDPAFGGSPTQYGGGPAQYGSGPAQHGTSSQYGAPTRYGDRASYSDPTQYGIPPQQPTYPPQQPASAEPDPFAQGPYPPRPARLPGGTYGRTYGGPPQPQGGPPQPPPYAPTEFRAPTRSMPPQRPEQPPYRGGRYADGPGAYGDERYPFRGEDFGANSRAEGAGTDAPKSKRTLLVLAIAVVVLIVAGGGWYYLHRDSAGTVAANTNPPTAEQAQKVADQKVDPAPLTEAEVFGAGTIPSSADGGGSYKIVKTQAATDCKSAVGGDIATALASAGCTQVVRATMTSPDGAYVITGGIFNLADATKAGDAQAAIKTAINDHKGRFSGLAGGGATNVIELAAANVAWDVRGHYLMYCVIAKANGSAIASDDSRTPLIIADVVESYLGGTVIHRRETGAGPTAQPS